MIPTRAGGGPRSRLWLPPMPTPGRVPCGARERSCAYQQAGPIDTRVAGVPLDKLGAVCFRPPLQVRGLQLVLCNSHFGQATPRPKATGNPWFYRQHLEAGLLIPDDPTRSPRHAGMVVVPRAPTLDHAASVEGSNRTPPATDRSTSCPRCRSAAHRAGGALGRGRHRVADRRPGGAVELQARGPLRI